MSAPVTADEPEDGEIQDLYQGAAYHPSLEWPGEDVDQASPPISRSNSGQNFLTPPYSDSQYETATALSSTPPPSIPSLRLIRLPNDASKHILPKSQILAILDGYTEVEIGRDIAPPGNDKPRIRLKEMEVSKLHATIYWDAERHDWALVDMGSKHGTFIRVSTHSASNSNGTASDPRGQRLSPARASSIPRRLGHLDQLSIGSTTFVAHIHDGIPCEVCTSSGGDEISLFNGRSSTNTAATSNKRKWEPAEPPLPAQRDPKKALSTLKRTLLSLHDKHESGSKGAYVDRSARRRALHPDSASKIPGDNHGHQDSSAYLTVATSLPTPPRPPSPPAPLPSSNIGHRLLMKQGWSPGTALRTPPISTSHDSTSSVDLVSPLEPKVRPSRAGLGSSEPTSSNSPIPRTLSTSWKEEGKQRRWTSMNPP